MTIKELKDYVKDLQEIDEVTGDPFEFWMMTGHGISSEVSTLRQLNSGDVICSTKEWD